MQQRMIDFEVLDIIMETIEALPDSGSYKGTVVMAHGFPDNFHSFDQCLGPLVNAGYRVYVPSLACFSKKSLIKDGNCTWTNQAKYLRAFIDRIDGAVHYVGHDKGGMLTNPVAALGQDKFKSLTTMCVGIPATSLEMTMTNPIQMFNIWYTVFFNFKGYADEVFKFNDYQFIDILWSSWSPGWRYSKEQLESVKATFRENGVTESALESYRQTMQNPNDNTYSDLVLEVPVLYIGGLKDGCLNSNAYTKNSEDNHLKGSEIQMLDCGHFPQMELPEELCKVLVEFFDKYND